jgi:polyisoprenyl-phosphate glycosyltransferase
MEEQSVKLSVVIPSYNESENIESTVAEVISRIRGHVEEYEVIVIDDHSADETFERLLAMKGVTMRCLRLSRRSGSHVALRVGLAAATGDVALCISADGQDDPSVVGHMLERWRSGAHIVWALRRDRNEEPLHIRLLARVFYRLLRYFNQPANRDLDLSRADFYLLDRRVVDAVGSCGERITSLFGLIAWMGFRQESVDYVRRLRRSGNSKWNFSSRMALALDWIVAFSWLPLRFSIMLGLTLAAVGALYALFVVINAILGRPVEGWSSVIMAVLILSGVQLVMLGAIGEYVGRGLDEARKRPIAFVEREIRKDDQFS